VENIQANGTVSFDDSKEITLDKPAEIKEITVYFMQKLIVGLETIYKNGKQTQIIKSFSPAKKHLY